MVQTFHLQQAQRRLSSTNSRLQVCA